MDDQQHYSLRWNNFSTKIATAFQALRDEEDFVDVTIACDGHSFTGHKIVLSACSPFFHALLKVNPCKHPIVILNNVTHGQMEKLLEFMYNGEVSIAQEQLAAFLKTADNLKIRGLAGTSNGMENFQNVDNCNGIPIEELKALVTASEILANPLANPVTLHSNIMNPPPAGLTNPTALHTNIINPAALHTNIVNSIPLHTNIMNSTPERFPTVGRTNSPPGVINPPQNEMCPPNKKRKRSSDETIDSVALSEDGSCDNGLNSPPHEAPATVKCEALVQQPMESPIFVPTNYKNYASVSPTNNSDSSPQGVDLSTCETDDKQDSWCKSMLDMSKANDPTLPADVSATKDGGPIQPAMETYPMNKKSRRRWNGEHREWTEYSVSRDTVYCFACRHFPTTVKKGVVSRQFTVYGFDRWNDTGRAFLKHENSACHKDSEAQWRAYIMSKNVSQ